MSRAGIKVIQESSFFDEKEYAGKYPDVAMSGLGAAEHYFHIGGRLGRAPGPGFDAAGYLARYLDVAGRGDNPLVHFERHGSGEGRDPRPAPASPVQQKDTDGKTRIDIIVPVYNALEDVKACLNSLKACETSFALRTIVINDGSDKATSSWLQAFCAASQEGAARFELIDHQGNRGYTKAVNTGLQASDAPYLVTLNSDTIVTPFWADGLVRCLESDPQLGIVGPLSNAASWQNVPALMAPEGGFAINALPDGISPADMAGIVRQASRRTYPRSPFVNGFCFMLRREVLDAVGYMDEVAFPTGYGEENDFCIRAQDAGFTLAFADDTYVFHAKSKSFGTARREELSRAGSAAIREKHGAEKFSALTDKVKDTAAMDTVRGWVQGALKRTTQTLPAAALSWVAEQKILFLLPVQGGGGGAHSVVQEATAMRRMGIEVKIAVHDADYHNFMTIYGDIPEASDIFTGFREETVVATAQPFDVVVATIYSSVRMLDRIVQACPWILPAYYAQDYEPWFFEEGTANWTEAYESYTRIPDMLIFAKTHWICQQIETNHHVPVHKVEPSIDHEVYGLGPAGPMRDSAQLCITAMIRPSTPRRGAERTMQLLARLRQRLGNKARIEIFGCRDDAEDFLALPRDFEFANRGILTRPGVADLLKSADVFIDLSDYQAFGRTGLEAMACGALSVVPKAGGGDEYAIDGQNALVVDSFDVDTCYARLMAVLEDRERLVALRMAGLETASRYSPRRAALSELLTFSRAIAAHRKLHQKPTRSSVTLMPALTRNHPVTITGSGYVRTICPYRQDGLARTWETALNLGEALPRPGSADIAVVQRDLPEKLCGDFSEWAGAWKAEGGRIIYEIDDDLTDVQALLDRGYGDGAARLQDRVRTYAGMADAITVSTRQLMSVLSEFSDKIHLVPNYIDAHLWNLIDAPPARPARSGPLKLGYVGTPTHTDDLGMVQQVIRDIEDSHDIEVEVVGAFQHIKPLFGKRIGLPRNSVYPIFVSWLQQAVDWDITIIPLKDTTFNRAKSNLKFIECAALNTAIVCSDNAEYRDVARDGENCLMVPNEPERWKEAIERLLEDHALRTRLAQAAYQDVRDKWTVQRNIGLYEEVLRKTLAAN